MRPQLQGGDSVRRLVLRQSNRRRRVTPIATLACSWSHRSPAALRNQFCRAPLAATLLRERPRRFVHKAQRSIWSSIQMSPRDSVMGIRRCVAVNAISICTVCGDIRNCGDRKDVTGKGFADRRSVPVVESSSPDVSHAVPIGHVVQHASIRSPPWLVVERRAVCHRPPRSTGGRDDIDGRCRVVHQIVGEKRDPPLVGREPLVEQIALRIRGDHANTVRAGIARHWKYAGRVADRTDRNGTSPGSIRRCWTSRTPASRPLRASSGALATPIGIQQRQYRRTASLRNAGTRAARRPETIGASTASSRDWTAGAARDRLRRIAPRVRCGQRGPRDTRPWSHQPGRRNRPRLCFPG